jgi:hypothetical protein
LGQVGQVVRDVGDEVGENLESKNGFKETKFFFGIWSQSADKLTIHSVPCSFSIIKLNLKFIQIVMLRENLERGKTFQRKLSQNIKLIQIFIVEFFKMR